MRAFKHRESVFSRAVKYISFKLFGHCRKKRISQDLLYDLAVRAIVSDRYQDIYDLNSLATSCYGRKFFLEYKNRLANYLIHKAQWKYNEVIEKPESEEVKNED